MQTEPKQEEEMPLEETVYVMDVPVSSKDGNGKDMSDTFNQYVDQFFAALSAAEGIPPGHASDYRLKMERFAYGQLKKIQQLYSDELGDDYWSLIRGVAGSEGFTPVTMLFHTANYLWNERCVPGIDQWKAKSTAKLDEMLSD